MPRKSPFPSLTIAIACPHCSHKVKHLAKHIRKYHPEKFTAQFPRNEGNKGNLEAFPSSESSSQADPSSNPEIKELEKSVLETERTYNPEIQTEANLASDSDLEAEKDTETLLDPVAVQYITAVLFKTISRLSNEPLWELDKDEVKILMPPLTKVLNKYAPSILKDYQDEAVLAATFGSIMLAKMQLIRAQKKTTEVNHNARRNENTNIEHQPGNGSGGISGGRNFPKPEPLPQQND